MTTAQRRTARPGGGLLASVAKGDLGDRGSQVVSAVVLEATLTAADNAGVDTRSLLADLGLTRDAFVGSERLLSVQLEESIWAALIERVQDRGFGVRAASALTRGAFRAVEYVGRASDTFGGALRQLVRFDRVLHGVDTFRLVAAGRGTTVLHYDSPHWENAQVGPYVTEFALASVVVLGRDATGVDWAPREVGFEHEMPRDTSALAALFRCPIRFEREWHRIVLPRELLDMRMREADPLLCSLLQEYLQRAADGLPPGPSISEAVRRVVAESLAQGAPGLEEAARRVGLSGRALQRRLGEENLTFQGLLDEVRESLAHRYLRRPGLSVQEIAALLGYSDASAFQRAFKRWTGVTPARYRRELAA